MLWTDGWINLLACLEERKEEISVKSSQLSATTGNLLMGCKYEGPDALLLLLAIKSDFLAGLTEAKVETYYCQNIETIDCG
jgi:hypothetical protein